MEGLSDYLLKLQDTTHYKLYFDYILNQKETKKKSEKLF